MSDIPADLKYTTSHEWVRENDDGTLTIGITDHAQSALGDLVFVELPDIGATFAAQENCAVVESVKAASDIYCPLAGEITDVNTRLEEEPELINSSPFEEGWIMTLQPDDARDLEELIGADEYLEALE
ncbi:MAG: glycine cleavage system protein GcvH [Gammaproteobacteria bacterium]|nr:glycine cleavage system protein GcvH [Gammaproteobacteria bacterium]